MISSRRSAGLLVFFRTALAIQMLVAKEKMPPPAWIAQIPAPVPGTFALPAPVSLSYTAGWAGITAGELTATYNREENRQRLTLTGGTIGPARVLYRLDADASSTCDQKSLAPLRADIRETYSDEDRQTIQKYTETFVTHSRTCQPPRKDDGKEKKTTLPHLLSLQSSLLYLRSQTLNIGDEITFFSFATGSPYLAKVKVLGRENLTVRSGTYPALKLRLDLQSIDKSFHLKPYKRAKNITAWISDDENRYFLKFTADLLIGTVFVELQKVTIASASS